MTNKLEDLLNEAKKISDRILACNHDADCFCKYDGEQLAKRIMILSPMLRSLYESEETNDN